MTRSLTLCFALCAVWTTWATQSPNITTPVPQTQTQTPNITATNATSPITTNIPSNITSNITSSSSTSSPPQSTMIPNGNNNTVVNPTATTQPPIMTTATTSTTTAATTGPTSNQTNGTTVVPAKVTTQVFVPPHPKGLIDSMLAFFIIGITIFAIASCVMIWRCVEDDCKEFNECECLDDDSASLVACLCVVIGIMMIIAFGTAWGVLRCENDLKCEDTENGGAYRRGGVYYGSSYAARRGGSSGGRGSCFPASTRIAFGGNTQDYKKIEDVRVGDVLAWNVRVQAVHTFMHFFGDGSLYLYRFSNDEIIVAADHLIYEKGKWIYVRDSVHAHSLALKDARKELTKRGVPIGKDVETGNEWITLYNFDTDFHVLPLAYDFFEKNLSGAFDENNRGGRVVPIFSDNALMDELDEYSDAVANNISGIEVLEVNSVWKMHQSRFFAQVIS